MKIIALSALMVVCVGLAPATQPVDTQLQQLKTELATLRAPYGTAYPDTYPMVILREQIAKLEKSGPATEPVATSAPKTKEAELAQLEEMLVLMKFAYGDNHPQIVQLKAVIAQMEAAGVKAASRDSVPPMKQRSLGDRLLSIKMQLAGERSELGAENPAVRSLQVMAGVFEAKVAKIDLDQAKERLDELVSAREIMVKEYPSLNPRIVAMTKEIDFLKSIIIGETK